MIKFKNTGNVDTRSGFGEGLLELGKEARFNIPGTKEKNWVWRLEDLDILKNIKKDLKKLNKYTDRA